MELFKIINQPKQKILNLYVTTEMGQFFKVSFLSNFSKTSHATIQNPLDNFSLW